MAAEGVGGRLARALALNRTVAVVLVSVLFFGLGEHLWSSFLPAYLTADTKGVARQAASAGEVPAVALAVVGVYACLHNLFEALCYLAGGGLTSRLGDRGSLLLFAALTLSGYALFLAVPAGWPAGIAALLILGWEPLSTPVTFTTVGATVESKRRGMAFALQSTQKRLPKVLGPAAAGLVLAMAERMTGSRSEGIVTGLRWLVGAAFALGVVSVAIQWRWMPKRKAVPSGQSALAILRGLDPALRRLLLAEVFTRWCDWLVREFVVLYVLLVRGLTPQQAGYLFAAQHLTALLTYLPIGRMTERVGLRPFVGVTFVFFALFPLALALVPTGVILLAFIVYGLREVGEPARKALITSLLPEEVRARGVGLYWGVRSVAVCAAPLAGAVLWHFAGPEALLYAAFGCGVVGAGVYYATAWR